VTVVDNEGTIVFVDGLGCGFPAGVPVRMFIRYVLDSDHTVIATIVQYFAKVRVLQFREPRIVNG
jgi:hypothetical protein